MEKLAGEDSSYTTHWQRPHRCHLEFLGSSLTKLFQLGTVRPEEELRLSLFSLLANQDCQALSHASSGSRFFSGFEQVQDVSDRRVWVSKVALWRRRLFDAANYLPLCDSEQMKMGVLLSKVKVPLGSVEVADREKKHRSHGCRGSFDAFMLVWLSCISTPFLSFASVRPTSRVPFLDIFAQLAVPLRH